VKKALKNYASSGNFLLVWYSLLERFPNVVMEKDFKKLLTKNDFLF